MPISPERWRLENFCIRHAASSWLPLVPLRISSQRKKKKERFALNWICRLVLRLRRHDNNGWENSLKCQPGHLRLDNKDRCTTQEIMANKEKGGNCKGIFVRRIDSDGATQVVFIGIGHTITTKNDITLYLLILCRYRTFHLGQRKTKRL